MQHNTNDRVWDRSMSSGYCDVLTTSLYEVIVDTPVSLTLYSICITVSRVVPVSDKTQSDNPKALVAKVTMTMTIVSLAQLTTGLSSSSFAAYFFFFFS